MDWREDYKKKMCIRDRIMEVKIKKTWNMTTYIYGMEGSTTILDWKLFIKWEMVERAEKV